MTYNVSWNRYRCSKHAVLSWSCCWRPTVSPNVRLKCTGTHWWIERVCVGVRTDIEHVCVGVRTGIEHVCVGVRTGIEHVCVGVRCLCWHQDRNLNMSVLASDVCVDIRTGTWTCLCWRQVSMLTSWQDLNLNMSVLASGVYVGVRIEIEHVCVGARCLCWRQDMNLNMFVLASGVYVDVRTGLEHVCVDARCLCWRQGRDFSTWWGWQMGWGANNIHAT